MTRYALRIESDAYTALRLMAAPYRWTRALKELLTRNDAPVYWVDRRPIEVAELGVWHLYGSTDLFYTSIDLDHPQRQQLVDIFNYHRMMTRRHGRSFLTIGRRSYSAALPHHKVPTVIDAIGLGWLQPEFPWVRSKKKKYFEVGEDGQLDS